MKVKTQPYKIYAAKAVLRGKFIAIPDFFKKQEKSHKHPNLLLLERLRKRRVKKTQSQKKQRNDKRLARRWWLHHFVIET